MEDENEKLDKFVEQFTPVYRHPSFSMCIMNKALSIYIPPGGMKIFCPEHPEGHFLQGSSTIC
jgi:hypothetical protein